LDAEGVDRGCLAIEQSIFAAPHTPNFPLPGIPFQLTIGWIVQQGSACFEHDEHLIARFLAFNEEAWRREACRSNTIAHKNLYSAKP
jgi:hypothetical protein